MFTPDSSPARANGELAGHAIAVGHVPQARLGSALYGVRPHLSMESLGMSRDFLPTKVIRLLAASVPD
jgi:hypothetical protein